MVSDQENLAAAFLLGKLSEDERVEVEREFFHKADVFENILIAENSLTDAYVTNRLSLEDRVLFENRLLINPRQRQSAAFAETLVRYASRLPVDDLISSPSGSNWSTLVSRFFSTGPLLSYSLAAAVVVLLAGAAFWWASNNSRPIVDQDLAKADTPVEVEIQNPVSDRQIDGQTTSNQPDKPSSAEDKHSPIKGHVPQTRSVAIISTLILQPGSIRGIERAKSFVIPGETNLVNLQLKFDEGEFSSYFAVLETVDGQQVWRGKAIKSRENNTEKTVTMPVPARLLKRGDYITRLKGLTKEGVYEPVADYSFTVDRR